MCSDKFFLFLCVGCLWSLSMISWLYLIGSIYGLYSVPLINLPILLWIPHYLDYFSFILSLGLPWWLSSKESACRVGDISSVQFSLLVVSDSLWPHGLQHAKPPCPSPTLEVYSNSCPLSWWWHPIISSSVLPLSSHLWSFPASGSFPMSQFFASGGQNIGVPLQHQSFQWTFRTDLL